MRSYSVPVLKYIFTTLYLSFRCYLPWSNAIFPFLPLADDIDLMAARMKSCRLSYTASGMNISFDRSKTMVNSVGQETWEIQLNGMQLEEVQRFKCLGARLSKDGSCTMGCTFWLIRRERSRYLNTGYYLLRGTELKRILSQSGHHPERSPMSLCSPPSEAGLARTCRWPWHIAQDSPSGMVGGRMSRRQVEKAVGE